MFSAAERLAHIPNLLKYVPMLIINLDGAPHRSIRTLLLKAFGRRTVEQVRDYAAQRVDFLLTQALSRTSIEFNEDFARALTGHVLFRLIGMPESLFPSLKDWATAIVEGLGAGTPTIAKLQRADWAVREMNDAVLAELALRRAAPRDDLLTSLLQATEDGDTLTVDELLAQMQIIIVAGHDTTANTMTLGLEALHRHPEAWQYLYEHPERNTRGQYRLFTQQQGLARVCARPSLLPGTRSRKDAAKRISVGFGPARGTGYHSR